MQQQLDLAKANNYNFEKHHVNKGFQSDSIEQIAANVVGLHSARLPTAFVSLISRMPTFQPKDLQHTLYEGCTLIKLRCMRKTLHTVPHELAPIVHNSTLNLRLADLRLYFKRANIDSKQIDCVSELIKTLLSNSPATPRQICDFVTLKYNLDIKSVKYILKYLWETGVVCYINTSKHWGEEIRYFDLTQKRYPQLGLNNLDLVTSARELVKRHVKQFGPVTAKDIAWWSGLPISLIRECLDYHKGNILKIRVKDQNTDFYIDNQELENLMKWKFSNDRNLTLLAYEDSSLKGYFESRFRYVSKHNYDRLFNQIGEARASILLNGEVIGIWTWNKKFKKIEHELFSKLDDSFTKLLEFEKARFEKCLNPPVITPQPNLFSGLCL